jgi:hypothetical protein
MKPIFGGERGRSKPERKENKGKDVVEKHGATTKAWIAATA